MLKKEVSADVTDIVERTLRSAKKRNRSASDEKSTVEQLELRALLSVFSVLSV
jgi:hypothetical protein